MGLGAMLFGGEEAGKAVAAPVEAIGNLFDELFTSDEERAQAQAVLEKLRQHPDELQAAITLQEASHPSVFVAGWRPAVGWVCVISLAAYYPPRFIAATVLWIMQVADKSVWIAPPEVGIADILGLVGTLLGSAVIRTWEKREGVAR